MPESKAHQVFRSRIESIELYLEAMDAAARIAFNILGRVENREKTISDALPINCENYRKLNHPASHRSRIYTFCKSKNYKSAIIENFGAFSEYMKSILSEMYEFNPMSVVGKSSKPLNMPFHELAKIGNFEEVKTKMISEVFRSLENERSTIKLIDKIINGTNVNITENDKNAVLPYLEMRHLFIHNHSKIDDKFDRNFGESFGLKENDKVPTTYENASKALLETLIFVAKLDQELIANNHIEAIQL